MVMKVRRTQEWDIPDLHAKLQEAARESSKSITQICKEAELSTAFWYELAKGRKNSITFESLERLCKALELTLEGVGVSDDEASDD
ncbi:MAG: helix-turn-helix transcriptional regulator [Cyanobacteria bacterium J06634_6]